MAHALSIGDRHDVSNAAHSPAQAEGRKVRRWSAGDRNLEKTIASYRASARRARGAHTTGPPRHVTCAYSRFLAHTQPLKRP